MSLLPHLCRLDGNAKWHEVIQYSQSNVCLYVDVSRFRVFRISKDECAKHFLISKRNLEVNRRMADLTHKFVLNDLLQLVTLIPRDASRVLVESMYMFSYEACQLARLLGRTAGLDSS